MIGVVYPRPQAYRTGKPGDEARGSVSGYVRTAKMCKVLDSPIIQRLLTSSQDTTKLDLSVLLVTAAYGSLATSAVATSKGDSVLFPWL